VRDQQHRHAVGMAQRVEPFQPRSFSHGIEHRRRFIGDDEARQSD